jgi:DNA-binding NarL/FixJ family response regulator
VLQIQIAAECADADATMSAITQHRPDVVIMDFRLGAGTAVDVLRLCAVTSPRPICVVHTLETAASTRAISYAAGADVFYDKGKDLAPLVGMLRKLAGCMVEGEAREAA